MGAGGYEPMDDDCACDWLADEIEAPLLGAIKRTLQAYLDQTDRDDVKTIEAEAAAALLVDLTGSHAKMRYMNLDCSWLAREGNLWALATTVVNKIMQDEEWINSYNEPQEKMAVLKRILADLRHCQEGNRNN